MSEEPLISYAQNGEDVVLWRALSHVTDGRYVDVGACDPVDLSVTKALYDRGWRGIDIDPVPEYADRFRSARPGNEVVQAAITDRPTDTVTLHQLVDTGLSTLVDETADAHEQAGFERREISVPALPLDAVCDQSRVLGDELHVVKIDVEGAEAEVLRSFDLARWRPWVVVVEATRPLSTEPAYADWDPILTGAGYTCTLFDGLSRFYVSPDHPELVPSMSYPACVLDDYVSVAKHRQDVRVDELSLELSRAHQEITRWRNEAVGYWTHAVARVQKSEEAARDAQRRADRMERRVSRIRRQLEQVRADRKRLRARVQRMTARIESLEERLAQQRGPALRGVRTRLRAVVSKATGS